MPFDGDIARRAQVTRLKILLELCCRRPDASQKYSTTCLLSEALSNQSFIRHGILALNTFNENDELSEEVDRFFGLTYEQTGIVFGTMPKSRKRRTISSALRRLQAEPVRGDAPKRGDAMPHLTSDDLLRMAIYGRNTEEALQLIAEAPWLVKRRDNEGHTPLYWAAMKGLTLVVDELLSRGADANAATICGCTPLGAAASAGYLDIARTLLARGADPNRYRVSGYSMLHMVALIEDRESALATATLLIRAGADVHVPDDDEGYTPLQFLDENHPGFTRELEERGVLRGFW